METHRRHGLEPLEEHSRFYGVRQVLNLLFIIGVLAGIWLWLDKRQETATYILIAASVVKFIEVSMRIMRL